MTEEGDSAHPPNTEDALFGGAVTLVQPPRGGAYRVNVDAILLAAFAAGTLPASAPTRRARRAFDLGSGVGAVGLSLVHFNATEHVTMVEIDAFLAGLANLNRAKNNWQERISVICADVSDLSSAAAGSADLVVCNPPYIVEGRGRPPSAARARARSGSLAIFLDFARHLAGRRARVCFVYPASETTTLLMEFRQRGLEPKRLRPVHSHAQSVRARVVLVEATAGKPGGLHVEPPIFDTDAPAGGNGTKIESRI